MNRKRKELPILENITITDIAAEGKAIAKVDDLVIFVPYVVPGDIVDLKIRRKRRKYAEAVAVKFHKKSELRAEPFCEHFGVCGGCKWQCLPYKEQLKYKQKQVADCLERIAKVDIPEISPIIGSEKTQCYRNKLEFGFSNKRWLTDEEIKEDVKYDNMDAVGFHIPGAFDKILDIDKCYLMDDICNKIRNSIRDYALTHHLTFFDLREQVGLLRNVMIRNSSTGELMIVIQFHYLEAEEAQQAQDLMAFLRDKFNEITALMYVNNLKRNDTIGDLDILTFSGSSYIMEEMEGLKFKVGPKSFYQTNSEQAYKLYSVARNFANLTGKELVYDLYTGTGTIANFIAKKAKHVIGIEYVPEAINDAKINAELNDLNNIEFYAGDMKDILNKDFINEKGRPDIIITDPPRAGMHQDVIDILKFAAPKKIVYISCNPATQSRDLSLLDSDFKVVAIQPVDMFPHTHHIENVVLLEKR